MIELIFLFLFVFFSQSFDLEHWEYDNIKAQDASHVTGTTGTPGASNTPGAVTYYTTFHDLDSTNIESFYLYGGVSGSTYNDRLWKFDDSVNQWIYVGTGGSVRSHALGFSKGDKLIIIGGRDGTGALNDVYTYDTVGDSWNQVNAGGARTDSLIQPFYGGTCSTGEGLAYALCFGGGSDENTLYNNLYKFEYDGVNTVTWTWLSGDKDVTNSELDLGTDDGNYNADSKPGGLFGASSWTTKDGEFYLYGGKADSEATIFTGPNYFWKYSQSLDQWAYLSGEENITSPSITDGFGTPGTNYGSAYFSFEGYFYLMFGKTKYKSDGASQWVDNDFVFIFNPSDSNNYWLADYGSLNSIESENTGTKIPGIRSGVSAYRLKKTNQIYIFGGENSNAGYDSASLLTYSRNEFICGTIDPSTYFRIQKRSDSHPNRYQPECYCGTSPYQGSLCVDHSCDSIKWFEDSVCSGHGNCTGPNQCTCDSNEYSGDNCEMWTCNGIGKDDELACNSGSCIDLNQCDCTVNGTSGENCEIWECYDIDRNDATVCNAGGKCTAPNNCECFDQFNYDFSQNCVSTTTTQKFIYILNWLFEPANLWVPFSVIGGIIGFILVIICLIAVSIILCVFCCLRKNQSKKIKEKANQMFLDMENKAEEELQNYLILT